MILMRATSIARAIGRGRPWKWHSLRSLPFQGPKKSRFSGPTPYNGPCNGCCPHQNHYVPRHINNRYTNNYFASLPGLFLSSLEFFSGPCIRPQFSRILRRYDESSAETPTTPTNDSCLTGNGEPDPGISHLPEPGGTPHIPEPDYDVSDSCSGSESGWRDTATLRKEEFSALQFKKRVVILWIFSFILIFVKVYYNWTSVFAVEIQIYKDL